MGLARNGGKFGEELNDEKIGGDIGLADGDGAGEVAGWGGETADVGNRDELNIRPGGDDDTEKDFFCKISFSFLMKKIILAISDLN